MGQYRRELALERSDSGSSTIQQFTESRFNAIARAKSPAVTTKPVFHPSHSHRIWRIMSALIDAVPEWADADAFEQAREEMLQYGLSTGMSQEELFKLTDPDVILGLWTAAEAKGAED
jgi:predicted GTPase